MIAARFLSSADHRIAKILSGWSEPRWNHGTAAQQADWLKLVAQAHRGRDCGVYMKPGRWRTDPDKRPRAEAACLGESQFLPFRRRCVATFVRLPAEAVVTTPWVTANLLPCPPFLFTAIAVAFRDSIGRDVRAGLVNAVGRPVLSNPSKPIRHEAPGRRRRSRIVRTPPLLDVLLKAVMIAWGSMYMLYGPIRGPEGGPGAHGSI